MVEKYIEQLRRIDINGCAERILNEAREKKTTWEAEEFLKENLNGDHLELTLKILREELFVALEEMEAVGIFDKNLDDECEPFTDNKKMIDLIIEKCKDKGVSYARSVLDVLGVTEAGQNYVIKEIKKIKREDYRKEESERLKPLSQEEIEK